MNGNKNACLHFKIELTSICFTLYMYNTLFPRKDGLLVSGWTDHLIVSIFLSPWVWNINCTKHNVVKNLINHLVSL